MQFTEMNRKLQENFMEMTKDTSNLFEVAVDKNELWNLYLDSYPEGTNEIYKTKREYDCNCCRHFIKSIGNVVVIKDNTVKTIWDFETNDTTFQPVLNALSAYIKSKAVTDVYVSEFKKIGTYKNFGTSITGNVVEWNHFFLELPDKFVNRSSRSEGDIRGSFRSTRDVFIGSLEKITEESLLTVLELISQNSLYKGEEWKNVLGIFLGYKREYDMLPTEEKNIYAWVQSIKAGEAMARMKNHSIGTLLVNIGEGMDLDIAVRKYEAIIAPEHYKRPTAIFTKKMLEDAKKTIEELGYMDSLGRRYATLDDITVNNILFSNKDSAKRLSGIDIFDDMSKEVAVNPKRFSKVEEVSIDDFVTNILPTAKELEVYLENKHSSNMVSLIAPENKDAKSMFKWDNPFSWGYSGNITDSSMKENVKNAGGKVDGVLRFSIQWNDDGKDNSDLDAHCKEPSGNEIYFGNNRKPDVSKLGGQLDVDITQPQINVAVENITWSTKTKMKTGVYKFFVNKYSNRGNKNGFSAEVEFDGQIYSFNYNKELRTGENVNVAEVTLHEDGTFTIKELLPSSVSSRDIWNLKTNQFVPVSVTMFSPNYWNDNQSGNKHYFFMLKDCRNPEQPNSFYNEFLKEDLMKHKHFFEALGSKTKVSNCDDQLSGLGFSSTRRNELIVKVKGQMERVIKIKF